MTKKPLTALALAVASSLIASPALSGTKQESSIQYYGDAKPGKYDKKLEAAMIRKAAENIGDLRGSVDGLGNRYFIEDGELKGEKSGRLGFPVIKETLSGRIREEGSIPLS